MRQFVCDVVKDGQRGPPAPVCSHRIGLDSWGVQIAHVKRPVVVFLAPRSVIRGC